MAWAAAGRACLLVGGWRKGPKGGSLRAAAESFESEMMTGPGFCGIDFGTSNSAVSAGRDSAPKLVSLEGGGSTIPSAIFFNLDEKRVVYGRAALSEYLDGYRGRLMRSLKSVLGSDLISESTHIGSGRKSFKDIIGLFFGHLKARAEADTGYELEDAVVGRPVRFVDHDDEADRRAEEELCIIARSQGFRNVAFEYEPVAAAADYEARIGGEQLVLVVDIGGGTSDFSVVRLSPEARSEADRRRDILANSGLHLGGTDFDRNLSLATIMREMGFKSLLTNGVEIPPLYFFQMATWHLINFLYAPKSLSEVKSLVRESRHPELTRRLLTAVSEQRGHEIANLVEKSKIALTERALAHLDLDFVEEGWTLDIGREALASAIDGDVSRIVGTAVDAVARGAGLAPGDVDVVFLTGGSTALPGFRESIGKAFPEARIEQGDRFSSVATGLGLMAARRYR